jgi:hypothetical protein
MRNEKLSGCSNETPRPSAHNATPEQSNTNVKFPSVSHHDIIYMMQEHSEIDFRE